MRKAPITTNLVPESVGLQATLISCWVQVAHRAAIRFGLDADAIFVDAGIDPAVLYQPESRIPSHKVKRVWEMSAQLSGCPTYGLRAAEVAYPGMYHGLSIAISSSRTVASMISKMMRYRRIVDTLCINTLEETADEVRFTWDPIIGYEAEIGAEAMIACLLQLFRWSAGSEFSPSRMTFQHQEKGLAAEYEQFFNCVCEFEAAENAICFARKDIEIPLASANDTIAANSEQMTAEYLARVMRGDTVNAVYSMLLSHLGKQVLSIDWVAEEMMLSTRTLQRKLKKVGTTYEELLDDVKRELALQHIKNPMMSIQEIAHQLGFSDASNFGRSFRRWTNMAPVTYRHGIQ
jgi:AraC-like DNA-binding protein